MAAGTAVAVEAEAVTENATERAVRHCAGNSGLYAGFYSS